MINGIPVIQRAAKLNFGVKVCVVAAAALVSLTMVLYSLTSKSLGGSYASAVYTIYSLKINMFSLVFASFYSILILGLVAAVTALLTLFYSHKIAGPIFRIEQNLDAIGQGDLTVKTKFRAGDQLTAAADELNAMVSALNGTVRTIDAAVREAEDAEKRLKEAVAKGRVSESEASGAVTALRASVEAVGKACSGVKLKG